MPNARSMIMDRIDKSIPLDFALLSPKRKALCTEGFVMDRLHAIGIPCLPGGVVQSFCDLIAWGCVRIEVKAALPTTYRKGMKGGTYSWTFTVDQCSRGAYAEIIVLVMADLQTCHVFDHDDPLFYHDGQLKTGIGYTPDRFVSGRKSTLTPKIMADHRDKWALIEQQRQILSRELEYRASVARLMTA